MTSATVRAVIAIGVTLAVGALRANAQEVPGPPFGYTQYWAGQCLEALNRTESFLKRDIPDTAQYSPAADTIPTAAVQTGAECAAHLSVDGVTPRDLLVLGRLYLAIGDDQSAEAAFRRRLDGLTLDTARAHMLASMVSSYANARPARMEAARAVMDELEAIRGPAYALWKYAARDAISSRSLALQDTAAIPADLNATIVASRGLQASDRSEFASQILRNYVTLAGYKARRTFSYSEGKQLLAAARSELAAVPDIQRALDLSDAMFALYGTKAQTVQATTWIFGTKDAPGPHPMPGHAAVLVFGISPQFAAAIPRLRALTPEPIDAIMMHTAFGYFRRRGVLTPEAETAAVADYVRNDLKTDVTVAIEVPRFVVLPDERRIPQPTPNELFLGRRVGAGVLVTDPQGIIRGVFGFWDKLTEFEAGELLRRFTEQ